MPLSEPVEREHIHTRDIDCRGYRRGDGLWDIEGRLVDTKTYAFDNRYRGTVDPGNPVHEMWIRITVDDRLEIVAAEAATDKHPFPNCPAITPDYSCIVGSKIRPGWTALVRRKLGKSDGCTHLTRLLQELAVVSVQTVWPLVRGVVSQESTDEKRPPHLDTCHALRSDGPVVKALYPKWYRG